MNEYQVYLENEKIKRKLWCDIYVAAYKDDKIANHAEMMIDADKAFQSYEESFADFLTKEEFGE